MKTEPIWHRQTRDTINRLRNVRAKNPTLSVRDWKWILRHARILASEMQIPADRYWGVYINCVRTVAGMLSNHPPAVDLFEDDDDVSFEVNDVNPPF